MNVCPDCGQALAEPRAASCPHCGATLGAGGGTPPPPEGSSVPFEDRSLPFLTRLVETIKLAFSDPIGMFSRMPSGDIGPAVLYGVIVGTIGGVFSAVWQLVFGSLASIVEQTGAEEFAIQTGIVLFLLVFSPLFALVGLFISAGIYHLMLLLVGDGQRGFPITIRAVAYGYTPGLLGIVPLCGALVGGVWTIVLVILGAAYGHWTEGWRATLAYFLPLIFCCCLLAGLMMMFGLVGGIAG